MARSVWPTVRWLVALVVVAMCCPAAPAGATAPGSNGELLVWGYHGSQGLFLVDLDTGRVERAPVNTYVDDIGDVAWSPDGTRLALTRSETGAASTRDLVIIDIATGDERIVMRADPHEWLNGVTWAPSGDRLMVAYNRTWQHPEGPAQGLTEVDLSGGAIREIPITDLMEIFSVEWSPDGASLLLSLFGYLEDYTVKVCTMDVLSTDLRCLTDGYVPEWSPDGTEIVYRRFDGEDGDDEIAITIMDRIGSNRRDIPHLVATWETFDRTGDEPTISPDGTLLATVHSTTTRPVIEVFDLASKERRAYALGFTSLVKIWWRPVPTLSGFVDVPDDHTFSADVAWLAAEAITTGCNPPANTRFCPDRPVTRGQLAAMVARFLGLTDRADNPFVDDDDSVFQADIERIAAAGITHGCNPPDNDRFCPDRPATRGQLATMLARARDVPPASTPDRFVDDDESVHRHSIDAIAEAGIAFGCNPPTNDRFCPDALVTRAQLAALLHRSFV